MPSALAMAMALSKQDELPDDRLRNHAEVGHLLPNRAEPCEATAGTLNSPAAFSIAVCSSGASTMPSHAAFLAIL
jgi:hypothetical protein